MQQLDLVEEKTVNALIASVQDEIRKIRESGPKEVNLDKFKAESKRTSETTVTTNEFWANYISGQLQSKEALGWVDDYPGQVDQITVKDVQEMAVKYVSGKNLVKLILLPEGGKISTTDKGL